MQSCIRPYDAIGRYGGEEFLIILPGCDEQCTSRQAERMRSVLDAEQMIVNERRLSITCSFGATTWHPGEPISPDGLIRVADDMLYEAKHQGRNRVVCQTAA
jgi:diguanylate cyclase (GGDEF)-like protein